MKIEGKKTGNLAAKLHLNWFIFQSDSVHCLRPEKDKLV
jgi:hypothetical protein